MSLNLLSIVVNAKRVLADVHVIARWAFDGSIVSRWRTRKETELNVLSLAFAEVIRQRYGYAANRLSFVWRLPVNGQAARSEASTVEVSIILLEDRCCNETCCVCEEPCHDADEFPYAAPRSDIENCYRCISVFLCAECRVRIPDGWCCYECLEREDAKHVSSGALTRMKAVRPDLVDYLEDKSSTVNTQIALTGIIQNPTSGQVPRGPWPGLGCEGLTGRV